VAKRAADANDAARKQLRAIARELAGIRFRLLGVIASLSSERDDEDQEEGERRAGRATVLRSAAECVLADNIRPAIDDLLTVAGDRRRGRKRRSARPREPALNLAYGVDSGPPCLDFIARCDP